MTPPALRSLLACTALAVLAFPIHRSIRPSPSDSSAVPRAAEINRSWSAVERQVEEDTAGYQRRVSARLHRAASEVTQLEALSHRARAQDRPYLGTRVRALREHLEYARAELIKLPTSTGEPGFTLAHAHFYRTVQHLDSALAQAADELSER